MLILFGKSELNYSGHFWVSWTGKKKTTFSTRRINGGHSFWRQITPKAVTISVRTAQVGCFFGGIESMWVQSSNVKEKMLSDGGRKNICNTSKFWSQLFSLISCNSLYAGVSMLFRMFYVVLIIKVVWLTRTMIQFGKSDYYGG